MSTWYIRNGVLCHHGIQGQKWGVRNAEWYPISAWRNSLKGSITKYKNKKKMSKVRAAKEEKAKEQAERNKLLDTATPSKLVKLNKKYKFTSDEIKRVQDRFANEKALKDLANNTARNRVKEISDKIGPIVDAMKLFNTVASTTMAAKNNVDKIRKLLNGESIDLEDKKEKEDKKQNDSSDADKTEKNTATSTNGVEGSKWANKAAEAAASKVAKEIIQPYFEEKYLKIPAQDVLLLEDKLKHSVITHHGVEGQKWGVRNGPPYPLQRYGNGEIKNERGISPRDKQQLKDDLPSLAALSTIHLAAMSAISAAAMAPAFITSLPLVAATAVSYAIVKESEDRADRYRKQREKAPIDPKTGLHKKTKELSDKEDLKHVNPDVYSVSNTGTMNNCMLCSSAYDIRKRGYDVEAKRVTHGFKDSEVKRWYPGAEIKYTKLNPSSSASDRKNQISTIISGQGEGARGTLLINWKSTHGGHSVIYQVKNGKVEFLDGQVNKQLDDSFFSRIEDNVNYVRYDNIEPDWSKIKEEVVR